MQQNKRVSAEAIDLVRSTRHIENTKHPHIFLHSAAPKTRASSGKRSALCNKAADEVLQVGMSAFKSLSLQRTLFCAGVATSTATGAPRRGLFIVAPDQLTGQAPNGADQIEAAAAGLLVYDAIAATISNFAGRVYFDQSLQLRMEPLEIPQQPRIPAGATLVDVIAHPWSCAPEFEEADKRMWRKASEMGFEARQIGIDRWRLLRNGEELDDKRRPFSRHQIGVLLDAIRASEDQSAQAG